MSLNVTPKVRYNYNSDKSTDGTFRTTSDRTVLLVWRTVFETPAGVLNILSVLQSNAKRFFLTKRKDKAMKKLFISQPMNGKTDSEIAEVRARAVKDAENYLGEQVEVIDSFFQGAPANEKPLWFLGKSIELLSDADIVVFAKGWENARGCRIEKACAEAYGIDYIPTSI